MSEERFPGDLVRAQRRVWACEAATRAFVLAGPDGPVSSWPLPRQVEFGRLRAAQRAAQSAVEQHPVVAAAIADHRWTATVRALRAAALAPEAADADHPSGRSGPSPVAA